MNEITRHRPAVVVIAILAWQGWVVWRALTIGVFRFGGGVYRRKEESWLFWPMTVLFSAAVIVGAIAVFVRADSL